MRRAPRIARGPHAPRRARRLSAVYALVAGLLTPALVHAQPTVARAAEQARARSAAVNDTLTSSFDVDGVQVILRRVTANNVVAANLYLLGGTRQLVPATQGIELLLLEASGEGTARFPRERLRSQMAQLGSAIGVSPGVDWSTIGLRSTVANFDSTWAILADRVVAPTLEPAAFALVREQIVSAVRQRGDSPDALLEYLADSALFAGHHYGLSPVGTEASLMALTAEDVRRYHAESVSRSRLRLVVVGNVTEEHVTRLVRSTLGALPAGNYAWTLPTPPAEVRSGVTVQVRRLPTNYLQGYFVGPLATDPDYAALRLASAVLSGRLFSEVREKRNLTYAVNAPFLERAFAVGGLYVTTVAPDAVATIMQREIQNLQTGTITEVGLDRLVQQFIVTYFLDNETNADQANLLARAALYQGDWSYANRFVEDLRAVTPEDIRRASVKYFRNVRWAYIGDPQRVDRLLLERF